MSLKERFDAYGVAVRAGAITPQTEDEDAFRELAGLPPMSEAGKRAWQEDEGFRRPITLLHEPPTASTAPANDDEEEDA